MVYFTVIMSYPLTSPTVENRLNDLNKKIAETKKKIQLSEGQRKANFEEYDAKKHENIQKISNLKQNLKELYIEYAKTKNNDERVEPKSHARRESLSCGKKRTLVETIVKLEEDNVRLRKKHDLIKYEHEKQQQKYHLLLQEYKQMRSGKKQKIFKRKLEDPLLKKMTKLEVRLEHVRMLQIKANIMRMRYRTMRAELKEKSVFYASSLKDLENDIKEQENELKRLQGVKQEAIELKDNTQETLIREEVEATNSTKERNAVLQEYRERVQERKVELERLERMIFHSRPRDDFDTRGKSRVPATEDITKDEVTRLEATFAKLRSATGVSRSEDVLNRFLGQMATKDNLQKMRAATEQEKIALEKKRQELLDEMETRKFSESKNAEQNAEDVEKLNKSIEYERTRQEKAEEEIQRIRALIQDINIVLYRLCEKLRQVTDTVPESPSEIRDPLELIDLINEKVANTLEASEGAEKYFESLDEGFIEKFETMSVTTTSVEGKMMRANGKRLFSQFPLTPTPAAVPSDDEEDVPTRNTLKKQAQQLLDVKSRRKGFTFRR